MTMRQMVATLSLQLMKGGLFILLLSFFNLVIDDCFAGSSKGQSPVSASWFSSKSSKKVCDHEHLAVVSYCSQF